MAEHAAHPTHRKPGGLVGALLLGVIKRLWALALIAIVLFLSYRAVAYLVRALLLPAAPPPQIVDLPRHMKSFLKAAGPEFPGIAAVDNPRTPPAHYHRVGIFSQPDRFNTCTTSGCHAPLPHGKNKADRAFLNMHATSLHCGVCHLQTEQPSLPLAWYDIDSGRRAEPPALLRAFEWLEQSRTMKPASATAADQRTIVALMRAATAQGGDSPVLVSLVTHLAAERADSEEFDRVVDAARRIVPLHFRGEYGAKLALVDAQGAPRLGHPGNEAAVREYLANKDKLSGAALDEVLTRIHPARRKPTLTCGACHTPDKPLLDFGKIGYPPARVAQLNQPMITRAIERIADGQEFYMPAFTPGGPGGAALPTSAPTSAPAEGGR